MLRRGTILVQGNPPRPVVVTAVRGDEVELVMRDHQGILRPVVPKSQAKMLQQVEALKSRWFDPQSIAIASMESIDLNSGLALLRRLIRRPRRRVSVRGRSGVVLASGLYRIPVDLGTFLRFQYVPPLEGSFWVGTEESEGGMLVPLIDARAPEPEQGRHWPSRDSTLYKVIKDKFWQVILLPIEAGPSPEGIGQVRAYGGHGGTLETFLSNHVRVELPQPGERFVGPFGTEVQIVRSTSRTVTCRSEAHGNFQVPLSAFVYDYALPDNGEPGHHLQRAPLTTPAIPPEPSEPVSENAPSCWDRLSESAGLRGKPG